MTARPHAGPDRTYLPPMGRRWLLPLYDPLTRIAGISRVHDTLADRADIRSGHRILEIGCGTGNLLMAVARRRPGAELIGIDPDPGALRRARRKAARAGVPVALNRAFAGDLPVPDRSIDRVLSSFMLHHLDDDEKVRAMREACRVLRPGGELHLVDIAGPPPGKGLRGRLGHHSPRLTGNRPDRVLAAIRGGGFAEVTQSGHGSSRLGDYRYYRAVR
jgi:ubiquinone/menaquinone biosynthesis C-methylase UbiE